MNNDEKILRQNIRHLIKHVKTKRLNEEKKFNKLMKKLMVHELKTMLSESNTPDVEPTPNKSTGINVLSELLKKIIPVLEVDFKSLTTSAEQRKSFRAHIANAVVNLLTPAELNKSAGSDNIEEADVDEEITVNLDDKDPDADKFIDIRSDAEKKSDAEQDNVDPRDEFGAGVEGDETGRNMAYQSFKKIESNILDSYELLSNPEDQELFYDYLLANLKLYFDTFEDELDPSVEEPTNQAYQQAKSDQGADISMDSQPKDDQFDLEI